MVIWEQAGRTGNICLYMTAPRCSGGKLHYKYVREHNQRQAHLGVQSKHYQTKLGHVGEGEGKGERERRISS